MIIVIGILVTLIWLGLVAIYSELIQTNKILKRNNELLEQANEIRIKRLKQFIHN